MNFSLTYIGILVAALGPILITQLGISEACSSELLGKIEVWAPAVIGGTVALWGRYKTGGITWYGKHI